MAKIFISSLLLIWQTLIVEYDYDTNNIEQSRWKAPHDEGMQW